MNIWSLLLFLLLLLACVVGARVLSKVLHPTATLLLGWTVGLSFYVAWCISFLKSNPPPPEDKDFWLLPLWLVLFPCAFLLVFPPGLLKLRKAYLLAMASFVAAEVYLVWSAFQILCDPNFDDSAGAFLCVPMMLFPACLLVCLLALRLFACAFKQIWKRMWIAGAR
jgi:hypothetical protein